MAQATMTKFVYNAETACEDFPVWKILFENFLLLSNIDHTKTTGASGATSGAVLALRYLINAADVLAIKLMRSFDDPEAVTYITLMEKLEAYCAPKDTGAMYLKFDSMRQGTNESLQDYVIRLKTAGALAGIVSTAMSKEVLRRIATSTISEEARQKSIEADMTVDKLLKWEATRIVKAQCVSASISSASYDVNFVQSHGSRHTGKTGSVGKCGRCGYEYPHKDNRCPADGKTCKKCNRPNHFAGVCREGQPPSGKGPQAGKSNGSSWKGAGANGSVGSRTGAAKKVYNVNSGQPSAEENGFGQDSKKAFEYFCAWMRNNRAAGEEISTPEDQE